MASDNEHIKNLLRDSDDSLPPDLSWDNMKEGIFDAMRAQQPAPEPPKRKRRVVLWWWLLLLCVGVGIPTGAYLYQKGTPDALTAPSTTPSAAPAQAPVAATVDTPSKVVVASESSSATIGVHAPVGPVAVGESAISAPLPRPSQPTRQTTTRTVEYAPQAHHRTPSAGTTLPSVAIAPELPAGTQNAIPNVLEVEPAPAASAGAGVAATAATSPAPVAGATAPIPSLIPPFPASMDESSEELPQAVPTSSKRAWTFGLVGSTARNINHPTSLDGSTTPGITAQETGLYAPSVLLQAQTPIWKGVFAHAGAEWQQLISRVDYTSVQPTQVQETNIVLFRQLNAITGATTEVRGDTLLSTTATRNVRHYNKSTLVSLPVGLGYGRGYGRWHIGVQLGALFNLRARHSGIKYLADGSLVPIMETENNGLLKDRLGMAWRGGVALDYRFTPHFSIAYQGSWTHHSADWSVSPDVVYRPDVISHGLGLRYSW